MITTRKIRAATAVAATAVLLTLAAAIPATAAPAADPVAYPIDHGIITLTSQNHWSMPRVALQETNEVYAFSNDARNVVASPPSWNLDQQKWRLIEVADDRYRLINVATGNALQSTNERTASGENIVTTPASWNNAHQEFFIVPVGGQAGNEVIIWAKGAIGWADSALGVSANSYLWYSDVFSVGTNVGWGHWTVTGYTFPAY